MKPGIYDLAAELYYADPSDPPSLSASIAKLLCNASPLHAWTNHPKLNPDYRPTVDETFDLGKIVHQVFLEGQAAVELIEADSYRTNTAKDARDEARAKGLIPLLMKQWDPVLEMVTAVREQLVSHQADPPLFRDGNAEVTLVWEEVNIVCRSRLDWLRDDYAAVDDLKTTSRSANPRAWSRSIFGFGYDVQAEFYCRGVEKLTGVRPDFRLCVVETSPPYAVSVLSLAPDTQTLARKKVDYAVELWARCLRNGEWPGYDPRVAYAELPAWEEAQWLEQELEAIA
jgi:hypothetical protein